MSDLVFKPGARVGAEDWTRNGEKISDPEKLAAIKQVLAKDGPILVEHKFLCGGRSPQNVVFDDYEEFVAYLTEHARAGDKISIWNLWPYMRDTQPLAQGNCPNAEGMVPTHGAY